MHDYAANQANASSTPPNLPNLNIPSGSPYANFQSANVFNALYFQGVTFKIYSDGLCPYSDYFATADENINTYGVVSSNTPGVHSFLRDLASGNYCNAFDSNEIAYYNGCPGNSTNSCDTGGKCSSSINGVGKCLTNSNGGGTCSCTSDAGPCGATYNCIPQVMFLEPGLGGAITSDYSEQGGNIQEGQKWVANIVNQVMQSQFGQVLPSF